jgi:hypothetical protein
LRKIIYYIRKFREKTKKIFAWSKIRRFGIKIVLADFIIFMCHRSHSDFQLAVIRMRDRIVQKYIHNDYEDILTKYREM